MERPRQNKPPKQTSLHEKWLYIINYGMVKKSKPKVTEISCRSSCQGHDQTACERTNKNETYRHEENPQFGAQMPN